MTDLLDPPTGRASSGAVSKVDFASQRWEVETSVPIAITGETAPGDADFVIASYATQSFGSEDSLKGVFTALDTLDDHSDNLRRDLDVDVDDVFDDLRRHLRAEFGLREITSILAISAAAAVLMSGGGFANSPGPEGAQLLPGLLAELVEVGTGIRRISQRDIIEGILEQFPVPIFGSPPSDISTITQLTHQSPFLAAVGYGVWSESPVLVVLAAGTGLVVWFARPAANVLRRSVAERLARKLGTEYRPEDEQ